MSLVVHMFAMGRASHLFWGWEGELAKTEKTKSCTRKEREKIGTQGSMGKRLGSILAAGHRTLYKNSNRI